MQDYGRRFDRRDRFDGGPREQRPTRPMPFSFLDGLLQKQVAVELTGGDMISGTLSSWDQHVNLLLTGAEKAGEPLGSIFLRGGVVVHVRAASAGQNGAKP